MDGMAQDRVEDGKGPPSPEVHREANKMLRLAIGGGLLLLPISLSGCDCFPTRPLISITLHLPMPVPRTLM
jgi:hypothetical protein